MSRSLGMTLSLLVFAAVSGCGFLGDDPSLDEFLFEEATHGTTIESSIDVAAFPPDIVFVGQLNTPSPCYRLVGEFEENGSDLTLRVIARATATTCDAIIGNFRYQGSIRNLDNGTYQLRIRHIFEGTNWQEQQFNVPVTIR